MSSRAPSPEVANPFPPSVEVLVVGGGPAGATAAAFLAAAGKEVLVIDQRSAGAGKVCGEFVSSEALPVLRRLGALGALRSAGALPIRAAQVRSARGGCLMAELPSDGGEAGFSLSRSAFDFLLLEEARRRGARVIHGARLTHLSRPEGGFRHARFRVGPSRGVLEARLVVGADGRNSRVAHLLGLQGRFSPPRMGIQVHLRRETRELRERVDLFLLRKAYAGVVPVEGDRWCVGALLHPRTAVGKDPWGNLLAECSGHSGGADALTGACAVLSRRAVFPVRFGLRECTAPGLLLAGDAAGVVDPFSGQGIALALTTGAEAAAAGVAILESGGDAPAERRRYAALVRSQIGRRLRSSRPLRLLLDSPRWSSRLLASLERHPETFRTLIGFTRARGSSSRLAVPRLIARLLLS